MILNPQAIKILEILEDGEKHCPIEWGYADGHGKRFTDINRFLASQGKTLAWAWCDCGRHTAKIKMRWIAPQMLQNEEKRYQGSTPPSPKVVLGAFEGQKGISQKERACVDNCLTQNPLFAYHGVREP